MEPLIGHGMPLAVLSLDHVGEHGVGVELAGHRSANAATRHCSP